PTPGRGYWPPAATGPDSRTRPGPLPAKMTVTCDPAGRCKSWHRRAPALPRTGKQKYAAKAAVFARFSGSWSVQLDSGQLPDHVAVKGLIVQCRAVRQRQHDPERAAIAHRHKVAIHPGRNNGPQAH